MQRRESSAKTSTKPHTLSNSKHRSGRLFNVLGRQSSGNIGTHHSTNQAKTRMESKSITQTLRDLTVGKNMDFPISKGKSIQNIIYQNLSPERSAGARWSVRNNVEQGVITVTRVC